MKAFRLLLLISLLLPFCCSSQEPRVQAVLDTAKLRIGEQAKIDLYFQYNANEGNLSVVWPEIGDTLSSKVEVISVSPIDTTIPDSKAPSYLLQHRQIVVSVYDSGFFSIPGFKFVVNGDTAKPLYTNSLMLEVHTVPTDTSAASLKDIKAPMEEAFNWKWYIEEIVYTSILFLLVGVSILIWYFRSLRQKAIMPEPEKPKVPAHLTALENLERIKTEQVWKDGKIKEYYSSISDTLRLYIEERYGLPALESTTDEIMLAFRSQVIDPKSLEILKQILQLSDLVKFAKMFPLEIEHEQTIRQAFDFVHGTKREDEESLKETFSENTENA